MLHIYGKIKYFFIVDNRNFVVLFQIYLKYFIHILSQCVKRNTFLLNFYQQNHYEIACVKKYCYKMLKFLQLNTFHFQRSLERVFQRNKFVPLAYIEFLVLFLSLKWWRNSSIFLRSFRSTLRIFETLKT